MADPLPAMATTSMDRTRRRVALTDGSAFDCRAGETLLMGALRAGVPLAYSCNAGCCGCCKVQVLEGGVEADSNAMSALSARDLAKNRTLACQAKPLTDCRIKGRLEAGPLQAVPPQRHAARLVSRRDLTPDLVEFHVRTEAPAEFHPGQFAMLSIDGQNIARAYSMANLPNAEGDWLFQIRQVPGGMVTPRLFAAGVAEYPSCTLEGPFGLNYYRPTPGRDLVCIAGGSGLAPMLSVARAFAADPGAAGDRLHFFYGARTPSDVCGEFEVAALRERHRGISYHAVVSDAAAAAKASWSGPIGFVHAYVDARLGAALRDHEIYFAGPPAMAEAIQHDLVVGHGIAAGHVHFDTFW
ncbi:2Fe-2S iron-sulfur cluster-binding protein [Algiphilus sp.]|uniref:2Fe-2S iron-sulfur cluster-binding protein n=1 Tax=Algiphilus sp. TaxID=1872431 RepID=UPI003BAC6512